MCCDAVRPVLSLGWVIRLQMYTRTALERQIASGTPRTRTLGMQLVNSDPGPMLMRSALEIASSTWGRGRALAGTRRNRAMPLRLAVILVSPRTRLPLCISASNCTLLLADEG